MSLPFFTQPPRWVLILAWIALWQSFSALSLDAQPPGARRDLTRQQQQQQQQLEQQKQRIQQQMREVADKATELPTDPQLLSLHKEFVLKAERLAMEYERKKEFDKARDVYTSLVRLVPSYAKGEEGLGRILGSQSVQDKQLSTILANQMWQDSGAQLIEGMPVHIEVQGTWKVVYETGPKGIEIPEEMKPRDGNIKLGTLIGVIASSPSELVDSKAMVIGEGKDFIAQKSGRLYLRMFDVDPTDNEGKVMVMVQSTFAR